MINTSPINQPKLSLFISKSETITRSLAETSPRTKQASNSSQTETNQKSIEDYTSDFIPVNFLPLDNNPEAVGKNMLHLGHIYEFSAGKNKIALAYYSEAANFENNPLACIHLALYHQHGEGILWSNQMNFTISDEKNQIIENLQYAAYYFAKGIIYETNPKTHKDYTQLYTNFLNDCNPNALIPIAQNLALKLPEAGQYAIHIYNRVLRCKNFQKKQSIITTLNKTLQHWTINSLFSSAKHCLDTANSEFNLTIGKCLIRLILTKSPDINTTKEITTLLKTTAKAMPGKKNCRERHQINKLKKIVSDHKSSINLLRVENNLI